MSSVISSVNLYINDKKVKVYLTLQHVMLDYTNKHIIWVLPVHGRILIPAQRQAQEKDNVHTHRSASSRWYSVFSD